MKVVLWASNVSKLHVYPTEKLDAEEREKFVRLVSGQPGAQEFWG